MRLLQAAALMLIGMSTTQADAWRLGAGFGQSTFEVDDIGFKDATTAWEVFVGYEFNQYLALEAGYLDGGKSKEDFVGAVLEADTTALTASVVGSFPVTESFSIYGRAGMLKWESNESVRFDGETLAQADVDGTDPLFGVGLAGVVDGALLRFEYRIADLDDADLRLVSLAVVWRF